MPEREIKPVEAPVNKPIQPEIREMPRQKVPEQPRIIRERPERIREVQPKKEFKRRTSLLIRKQEQTTS